MSTNPPSFRLPFTLPTEDEEAKIHPQVAAAIRYLFNGLVDVNQAIPIIVGKENPASTTASSPAQGQIIGKTNNQSGQAAVTLQQADYGALVVVSNGGGVAVSLNSLVNKPYYSKIKVDSGSGTATLTPTFGTINGAGFIHVSAGTMVEVFFNSDTNNWTAV